jgi:LacI family transcriptional regulator
MGAGRAAPPVTMSPASRKPDRTSRATIADVATHAGVSISTVSRVLNGRPEVSEATRESVLDAIRTHGFTSRRSPRGPSAKGRLVAVMLPDVRSEYFAGMLAGGLEALRALDMHAVFCSDPWSDDTETLHEQLLGRATNGAILLFPSMPPEQIGELAEHAYPFVVVDPRQPMPAGIASVTAANLNGARAVTGHLIELGHERIAVVSGPPELASMAERLLGFRAALASAKTLAPDDYVRQANLSIDTGYAAAQGLLDRPDRPTAIFAFNDRMALGVLQAARERGLRVPYDLSIAGFDDTELGQIATPGLTTVRIPLEEMGRIAVTQLARLMERQPVDSLQVELATTLIARGSTGPAPR